MGVTLSEDLLRARSHVWDASVDVLRRTRRNAFAIRGAAPDMTIDVLSRFDRERVPSHRHRSRDAATWQENRRDAYSTLARDFDLLDLSPMARR
jgi:hypothetical protein